MGDSLQKGMDRELYRASKWGDVKLLDQVLKGHIDVFQEETFKGDTALHIAAFFGHTKLAMKLMQKTSENPEAGMQFLKAQNTDGNTALHVVAKGGCEEMVRLLVEKDSGLACVKNHAGETALFKASENGHVGIVEYLLNYTPESEELDRRNDGQTPLHGAVFELHTGNTYRWKRNSSEKLSLTSYQGEVEYLNKWRISKILKHKNLVSILECCEEGSERLVVYEYLPNNSLAKLLFDPLRSNQLNWAMRFNIITGIARGLVYLHDQRIIRRDIKPSNIMLDQRMNAKIGDFGLARLIGEDESHVSTGILVGTFGYMAPEYALEGHLSLKADIYSFGVLLLEIVCEERT